MNGSDKPVVFISYSHSDKEWKNRLKKHLEVLEQDGQLEIWEDNRIDAGEDWFEEIQTAMNRASVAILLISANSLTSKFILNDEVSRLLQRRRDEGLRIYPVVVKSCAWDSVSWLKRMQVRPRDGKALSSYSANKKDEILTELVKEIHRLIQSAGSQSGSGNFVPPSPEDISISRLPVTGQNLFGRDDELKLLDEAWANRKVNVFSFVAWGGVGKSALVNYWLGQMAQESYRGAEKVYGWSFYSQGTTDRTAVSADLFIDSALRWFGDADSTKGSPWDKGERLAKLIKQQRTLLLLDGLEPLQNPPGYDEGKIKDQALKALLRELAADNPGLCVISTRIRVSDLENFEGSTGKHVDLDYLSPDVGAQLLRSMGVNGDDSEIKRAVTEFGGHSLALTLLGSYLNDVFEGDITHRTEVVGLEEDVRHGGHAKRVMASYEKWFGEGPELAVLRILGMFNRPADNPALEALRAAPAIQGLTDTLGPLSDQQWKQLLAKLRRAKLLSENRDQDNPALDTHPLIREHFGKQLKRERPDAWREGNNRLYEHLKRTSKQFPDTLEEMMPLYAGVVHGCEASRYEEALWDIYFKRIQREDQFYSMMLLGAINTDLATLVSFLEQDRHRPVAELSNLAKSFALDHIGVCFLALGRLDEALKFLKACLDLAALNQDSYYACAAACDLSESYLISGDLQQSLTFAEEAVDWANRSGNPKSQRTAKAGLANSFYQVGRTDEAELLFRAAETMQQEFDSHQFLFSLIGFHYCNLLLEQGEYSKVLSRSRQLLIWAKHSKMLREIALFNISLGRAQLIQDRTAHTGQLTQALNHFKEAVNNLRQSGQESYLPLGLLARAEGYRLINDLERSKADLSEAMNIAERAGMRLLQADCHLEYARFYLAQGAKQAAQESFNTAKEMIEQMGYHRRDKDVREIEQLLAQAQDY